MHRVRTAELGVHVLEVDLQGVADSSAQQRAGDPVLVIGSGASWRFHPGENAR